MDLSRESARLKRKRKERDTILKEQAKTKKAKEPAVEERAQEAPPSAQPEAEGEESVQSGDKEADGTLQISRSGKLQPPAFLPQEFLDSDEEDDDQDSPGVVGPQRKKLRRGPGGMDKAPRDKEVGGTIYRVAKTVDVRLAPKKQKGSDGVRRRLLARHRAGVPQAKGFLVGGPPGRPDFGSSRRNGA